MQIFQEKFVFVITAFISFATTVSDILHHTIEHSRQLSRIGYLRMANDMRPMECDKINHIFKPRLSVASEDQAEDYKKREDLDTAEVHVHRIYKFGKIGLGRIIAHSAERTDSGTGIAK